MNKKKFSAGLLVLMLCGFGSMNAQAAVEHKKTLSPEEQLLADLDMLHQTDSTCLRMIKTDDFCKMKRRLLQVQHQALSPVPQEPQHRAMEQRHSNFIIQYTVNVDTMNVQLNTHATVENAIRTHQMKLADALAAVKAWDSEATVMLSKLKGFREQFAQIGQDYRDIFQDHNTPVPAPAMQLINPPNTGY